MECKLSGTIMEVKTTQKNNKKYVVMYSDGNIYRIFPKEGENMEKFITNIGKPITLNVKVHEPKFITTL